MKYALRTTYEGMFDKIVHMGSVYIQGYNIKSMVMGVSGGIDSAVTAVLANAICRKLRNEYGYDCKLIGVIMPIESNKPEETERGTNICRTYCDQFHRSNLISPLKSLMEWMVEGSGDDNAYKMYKSRLEEEEPAVIETGVLVRRGNVKARLRMIQLYHLAHFHEGIVLSTDNLTELMLGFWTLHGDVGDLGFIQGLWKTEVYGLARWMIDNGYGEDALQACIDAVPTDGLGVSESDFDQLGCKSYREIDETFIEFFNLFNNDRDAIKKFNGNPVIERWKATQFKRFNPYNFDRADIIGFGENTDFI